VKRHMPLMNPIVLGIGLFFAQAAPEAPAEPHTVPVSVPFEGDYCDLIVQVRLAPLKPGLPEREFRFLLDTGAGVSVLDATVPTDYFWEEPTASGGAMTQMGDSSGVVTDTRLVFIKRLEFAGVIKDQQPAVIMDLKNSPMGTGQDQPVDGILGMAFLRGTRFVIDPEARQIRFWQALQGHEVKLGYSDGGVPAIPIRVAGKEVWVMLDTGSEGAFDLTGDTGANEAYEPHWSAGISGKVVETKGVTIDRVELAGKAWLNVPANLHKEGEGDALVGLPVLCAAPLGLNFINDTVTFQQDAAGNLPLRREHSAGLSLEWDRRQDNAHLRIGPLPPHSPMETAGFKPGDELRRVGTLEGNALTIRAIRNLVAQAKPLRWVVFRDGRERRLEFPRSSMNPTANSSNRPPAGVR
jgi:predicted aspartyl protease